MVVRPAFFREYVADRRRQDILSFDREDEGDLVRYTARVPQDDGTVVFASLAPGAEGDRIDAQIAHFAALGQSFEWKVYAFDRPADLRERLVARGFVPDEPETLMVFLPSRVAQRAPRRLAGCTVRAVVDDAGLDDVVAVQERVWAREFGWLWRALRAQLRDAPSTLSIYCGYRDGDPVGSAWIDYPAGSRFPELRGGSVVPAARGAGLYAALFDVRLREAVARGYEALCVDASPMSAPILEHLGFLPICTTTPLRMRFDA